MDHYGCVSAEHVKQNKMKASNLIQVVNIKHFKILVMKSSFNSYLSP